MSRFPFSHGRDRRPMRCRRCRYAIRGIRGIGRASEADISLHLWSMRKWIPPLQCWHGCRRRPRPCTKYLTRESERGRFTTVGNGGGIFRRGNLKYDSRRSAIPSLKRLTFAHTVPMLWPHNYLHREENGLFLSRSLRWAIANKSKMSFLEATLPPTAVACPLLILRRFRIVHVSSGCPGLLTSNNVRWATGTALNSTLCDATTATLSPRQMDMAGSERERGTYRVLESRKG